MVVFGAGLFYVLAHEAGEHLYMLLWQVLEILSKNLRHGLHNLLPTTPPSKPSQHPKPLPLPLHPPHIHNLTTANKARRAVPNIPQLNNNLILHLDLLTLQQQVPRNYKIVPFPHN